MAEMIKVQLTIAETLTVISALGRHIGHARAEALLLRKISPELCASYEREADTSATLLATVRNAVERIEQ